MRPKTRPSLVGSGTGTWLLTRINIVYIVLLHEVCISLLCSRRNVPMLLSTTGEEVREQHSNESRPPLLIAGSQAPLLGGRGHPLSRRPHPDKRGPPRRRPGRQRDRRSIRLYLSIAYSGRHKNVSRGHRGDLHITSWALRRKARQISDNMHESMHEM